MTAEARTSSRAFDQTEFRRILGQFATGVTIVTIVDQAGGLSGFTASAFSPVSLDPPLVLVCVKYAARSYRHLRQRQAFTIHFLDADQTRIAHSFAAPGGDRSMACDWRVNQRGFPILSEFHAALECRLFREYEGGDHAIIVGKVESIHARPDRRDPLVYYKGRLFPLGQVGGARARPAGYPSTSKT